MITEESNIEKNFSDFSNVTAGWRGEERAVKTLTNQNVVNELIKQYGIGNYISKKKISTYNVGSYNITIDCQGCITGIPCSCQIDNRNIHCPVLNECCKGCFKNPQNIL